MVVTSILLFKMFFKCEANVLGHEVAENECVSQSGCLWEE